MAEAKKIRLGVDELQKLENQDKGKEKKSELKWHTPEVIYISSDSEEGTDKVDQPESNDGQQESEGDEGRFCDWERKEIIMVSNSSEETNSSTEGSGWKSESDMWISDPSLSRQ